jgi:hypothetical protein
MNVPKIGERFNVATPGHVPGKSMGGSMIKLPPKGSAIKILPPRPADSQLEGSG